MSKKKLVQKETVIIYKIKRQQVGINITIGSMAKSYFSTT